MITAEAFQRNDLARGNRLFEKLIRVSRDGFAVLIEAQARAADMAGVRLGVKAAVERVLILFQAVWTHGENGHGRVFPVVRNIVYNCEARAAVRTVGKRVSVVPVSLSVDVGGAVFAKSDIRRDQRVPDSFLAEQNSELLVAERLHGMMADGLNQRERRMAFL